MPKARWMNPDTINDTAAGVAKVAPPATVAIANTAGITVPELINLLTLLYVTGLVIGMFWKAGMKIHAWWLERKRA